MFRPVKAIDDFLHNGDFIYIKINLCFDIWKTAYTDNLKNGIFSRKGAKGAKEFNGLED